MSARRRAGGGPAADSGAWVQRAAPPDHRDRRVTSSFRTDLVRSGDRVLLVDDRVATGATATTPQQVAHDAGGSWVRAAVVVDALQDSRLRRALTLRSLLHERQLR